MLFRNMEPVQEAYFGKTKNLLEAEKYLGQIMNKLKLKNINEIPKRVTEKALAINQSKENKKLCECFAKEFGFKEMIIHWDGTPVVNGYTHGAGGLIKFVSSGKPKLPVKQGERYYDSTHEYVCCVNIYAGLIDQGLTKGEMMSVILHEIAHNFECTPLNNFYLVMDYLWIPIYLCKVATLLKPTLNSLWPGAKEFNFNFKGFIYLYQTYQYLIQMFDLAEGQHYQENNSEFMKKAFQEMDKWIKDNKNKLVELWKARIKEHKEWQKQVAKDRDIFNTTLAGKLFDKWFCAILDGVFEPLNLAHQIYRAQSGYSGEVFADSFATAYGYGAETVSSQAKFAKMATNNVFTDKRNSYNVYNQYLILMAEFTSTLMDPHPLDQTRIKNQINKLRRELDSSEVPESMKKSIKADLDKAEKVYNEYLKLSDDERHLSILINVRIINETYFGGKMELRDITNRIFSLGMAEA